MTVSMPAPQDRPAYQAAEAARILGLPAGTVRAWCFGHDYVGRNDRQRHRFQPVIEPVDVAGKLLSFGNLCELHVLAAIRRRHGVHMPKVRRAIDYVSRELGVERPLANAQFSTNGIDLFVKAAGTLLNVAEQGQQAMRADFERALTRIEFGAAGGPLLLFPYTRPGDRAALQPRTVVVDPLRSFGRPVIAFAYVRTEVINDRFRAGDSAQEMAEDYRVGIQDIEEALRFEGRRAA